MKASVCAGLHSKIYPMRLNAKSKNRLESTHRSIEHPYEPEQEEIIHSVHIKSKSIDAFSDLDQLSSRRALRGVRKVVPLVNKSVTLSDTNNSGYQTQVCTRQDKSLSKFRKAMSNTNAIRRKSTRLVKQSIPSREDSEQELAFSKLQDSQLSSRVNEEILEESNYSSMDEEFYQAPIHKMTLGQRRDRQQSMKKKSFLSTTVDRAPTGGKDHFTFEEVSGRSEQFLTVGRCLIRMNSHCRVRWDLFVMLLAVVNCFLIPFEVAFTPNNDSLHSLLALNIAIDIAFLADIVINFRTTYVSNKSGEQIIEVKRIFRNYCIGRFWLDVVATIPFQWINLLFSHQQSQLFNLFGMFKVLRITRLQTIIKNLNVREQLKMTLKIFNFCFLLVLYVHLVACIWYYLVRQNMAWIPPLDFIWYQIYESYGDVYLFDQITDIYSSSVYHKYWVSVYHSVLMLTGNEVGPRTTAEACFAGVIIMLGAIINAYIFGHMAVLITSLEKNSSLFQERLDSINTSMKNMHLSKKIQKRVQNYLLYTQSNQHHKEQLRAFLKHLSPTLQSQVLHFFFRDVLRRNPVLKQESQQFHSTLVKMLDINFYQPDDVLIKQGEPEKDGIFFLVKGQCTVSVKDFKKGKPKFVRVLKPGALFGEVAMLYNCKRTANVKSINYSIVARLEKSNFEFITTQFPDVIKKLKEQANSYNDPWRYYVKSILSEISYLENISQGLLTQICVLLKDQFFKKGRELFREGDPCHSVVLITEGKVQLCIKMKANDKVEVFDILKQGSIIGEFWSISGLNYTFTARAKTDVTVHYLPGDLLLSLRESCPQLDKALVMTQEKFNKANSHGGVQCDIFHRVSKFTTDNPLFKFKRAITRMVKLARLRRNNVGASFTKLISMAKKSKQLPVQEGVQKASPNEKVDVLKTMNSQSTQRNVLDSLIFPVCRIQTFGANLSNEGKINRICQEMGQLQDQMKEIKQLLKAVLSKHTAASEIDFGNQTIRRKGSSFLQLVAKQLDENQESRLAQAASKRSQAMFGSKITQKNPTKQFRSQRSGSFTHGYNTKYLNTDTSFRIKFPSNKAAAASHSTCLSPLPEILTNQEKHNSDQIGTYEAGIEVQAKKSTQRLIIELQQLIGSGNSSLEESMEQVFENKQPEVEDSQPKKSQRSSEHHKRNDSYQILLRGDADDDDD